MSGSVLLGKAIRHPKRGKAHRPTEAWDLDSSPRYTQVACGLPPGSVAQMTQVVDRNVAALHDELCMTCFPANTPETNR